MRAGARRTQALIAARIAIPSQDRRAFNQKIPEHMQAEISLPMGAASASTGRSRASPICGNC